MDYPDGATPLDPDEIEGLLFKHVTTRGELDELEQANIQEGLIWLEKQTRPDVLTEAFVIKLHKELFGEVWSWAGSFRRTEKNIGIDPIQISVNLRNLLDDARYWVDHKTYSPIELAARFHHRLVQIHLFPNGNGRHARIMADTILTKLFKADGIDWAAGHTLEQMNKRRKEYIAALREADKGDYGQLLEFVGAVKS